MSPSELLLNIQDVIQAKSEAELELVFQRNPRLLEEGIVTDILKMIDQAEKEGFIDIAESLKAAMTIILTFVALNQQQEPYNIEPKVKWAINARCYLALRDEEFLNNAIFELEKSTETGIFSFFINSVEKQTIRFLKAFAKENYYELSELSQQLIPHFQKNNLEEEALTIFLFCLDIDAFNLPFVYEDEAREKCFNYCQRALEVSTILQDKACEALYMTILAIYFGKLHQIAEAEYFQKKALEYRLDLAEQEPVRFTHSVAVSLSNLADVQRLKRDFANAKISLYKALEIYRELPNQDSLELKAVTASTLSTLATIEFEEQNLTEAEISCSKVISIYQELINENPTVFTGLLAFSFNILGNIQLKLRKVADAENSANQAFAIYQRLAEKQPQEFDQYLAFTLNEVSKIQLEMGKFNNAEISCTKALKIYQGLAESNPQSFTSFLALTNNNLGNIQYIMKKFVTAEKCYSESLRIYQQLAEQKPQIFNKDVAMTLNNLGNVQRENSKLIDAEQSYIKALQIRRTLAKQEPHIFNQDVVVTLYNLGYLRFEQDDFFEAKKNFETSRDLIEDLRVKAITIDDRNRILQENFNIYNGLLACSIKMKDWKKALEVAELGKSRSLSDLLNLKSEDSQPKAPTFDTLATVKDLGQKYSDSIKKLQQLEGYERYLSEQLNQVENDITRLKDDENNDDTRQSFLRQIAEQKQSLEEEKQKVQHQRFAKQDELKSILEEIGKYDKDFPPKAKDIDVESIFAISEKQNRTIVMFRILHRSTAIIFVFPTGELHIKEISDFGQNEMFELFRDKWLIPYLQWKSEEIGIGNWKAAIEETLDTIYEKLLIHVHQILKEKSYCKEVLFVPNQSLALLPLHAASWRDENGKKHYLLEEYSISYAPSVSVFKRCQENEKLRSNKTLFVTNPTEDLDSSEKEVSFIAGFHQPSKNLLGREATKSKVIEALREDYGFTHFSCHGFYHQSNPFDSGLLMSDEVIKLSEIINCNLQNNWLTVLSACETGMVDFASPTDEHFGLPLSFIFAGSPSIWASLWSVSDVATSELMQMAYENLNTEEYKNNKPEALRQAQLMMIEDYSHPFFWAGFQHFGV